MRTLIAALVVTCLLLSFSWGSGFPVFQSGASGTNTQTASIQAPPTRQHSSQLERVIHEAVRQHVHWQIGELADIERLMYQNPEILKNSDLSVDGTVRSSGHSLLEVSDAYGNVLPVRAAIQQLAEAWVPIRSIQRGEQIRESDFRRELLPANQARNALDIPEVDFSALMVSSRNLTQGQVVRTTDVRREFAVQRGDIVEVIYRGERLTISMAAVATERAYLGDVIRLKNPTSGKLVMARLLPGKRAEIIH